MHMNYPCFFAATIKRLETRPFPNSSFMTGPIYFQFIDIVCCFLPVQPLCPALLGLGVLCSFGKDSSILFLAARAWQQQQQQKGFSEMVIRSLCGLARLGCLSLGLQSIQLNKVKAVLAEFIVSAFLNFHLIRRSFIAIGRALIII